MSWRIFMYRGVNLGIPADCETPNRLHDWFCGRSRRWLSGRCSDVGPLFGKKRSRAAVAEAIKRWSLTAGFLREELFWNGLVLRAFDKGVFAQEKGTYTYE